jgi:chromatin segregation and condensation protein Rec8/ScpA/Scc1 (kleisin family)
LLLALLELAHNGLVLLHQSGDFTTIRVKALHEIPEELEIEGLAFAMTGIF